MSRRRQIVSSAGLISAFTALSRVLGVVRDSIMGAKLGGSIYNDIFQAAFQIPNLTRRVLGEGALSAVIVPIITGIRKRDGEREAWRFAANALNLLLVGTLALTLAGMLFAKPLFYLNGGVGLREAVEKARTAPAPAIKIAGESGEIAAVEPAKKERPAAVDQFTEAEAIRLGSRLTAIMLPYVMLLTLVAFSMGVLHSLKHFAAPAMGSAVVNVVVIAAGVIFYYLGSRSFVHAMAFAILVSAVVRLGILLPPMIRRGFWPSLEFNHRDSGFQELLSKMPPMVLAAVLAIANLAVLNNLAGLTGEGGITSITYGQRVFQLPMALFSTALSTALLPQLSSLVVEDNRRDLRDTMYFAMRALALISFPAAFGLMALSRPIIQFLFEHGEWTHATTQGTAAVLFCFAIGLVGFDLQRILIPVYYARKDMVTPVKYQAVGMVLNFALMFMLVRTSLSFAGLALSSSIANTVTAGLLWRGLSKRYGHDFAGPALKNFLRALVCAAIMGLAIYFGYNASERIIMAKGTIPVFLLTITWVVLGGALYAALARIAGLWDRAALARILNR